MPTKNAETFFTMQYLSQYIVPPGAAFSALFRFAAGIIGGTELNRQLALFDSILAEYDNLISRICLGYARTKEDFEDLRQDVYANIWTGISSFRGEAKIKTWLYRVTLNTCVSTIRRRTKTVQKIRFDEFADIIDEDSERNMLLAELYETISTLPHLDKAIVLMWLDEISYDDIAEVIGMNRNTIAVRLHRAKDKLKKHYKS